MIEDREDGFTTTFWTDFSIADKFGKAAVQDTFNRAFDEWRGDYRYLTDLVVTLNHKIWQHYKTDEPLARLYNDLWETAQAYGYETLKGEQLEYFWRVLD